MRHFCVIYSNRMDFFNENEFANFIDIAVLHNKDIHNFHIIEIDKRLTEQDANLISLGTEYAFEVGKEIAEGKSPYQVIKKWYID